MFDKMLNKRVIFGLTSNVYNTSKDIISQSVVYMRELNDESKDSFNFICNIYRDRLDAISFDGLIDYSLNNDETIELPVYDILYDVFSNDSNKIKELGLEKVLQSFKLFKSRNNDILYQQDLHHFSFVVVYLDSKVDRLSSAMMKLLWMSEFKDDSVNISDLDSHLPLVVHTDSGIVDVKWMNDNKHILSTLDKFSGNNSIRRRPYLLDHYIPVNNIIDTKNVGLGVIIGENNIIRSNASLLLGSKIGDNCVIGGVINKGVTLGDRIIVGFNAIISQSYNGYELINTTIGDNSVISDLSCVCISLGKNCIVHPGVSLLPSSTVVITGLDFDIINKDNDINPILVECEDDTPESKIYHVSISELSGKDGLRYSNSHSYGSILVSISGIGEKDE